MQAAIHDHVRGWPPRPRALMPTPLPSRVRPRRRTGGRSARVVSDVLTTTLEELGRVGFAHLRVESVADHSGVNKTTIYRRWPDKSALVCAALRTVDGPDLDRDLGAVRADLVASFHASMRSWATERGRGLIRALIAEGADATVDRLARGLRERNLATRRAIVRRAIDRGELGPEVDVDLLLEILTNTVFTRIRQRTGPVDRDWLERVVDFLLAGRTTRSRRKLS
jgi:AcrR family transcriptional regulator